MKIKQNFLIVTGSISLLLITSVFSINIKNICENNNERTLYNIRLSKQERIKDSQDYFKEKSKLDSF